MKRLFPTLAIGMIGAMMGFQAANASDAGSPAVRSRSEDQGQTTPDNSKENVRDRDDATLTPMDQGTSEADRTITQQIRRVVMSHDNLSMDAKNVKIITQDGVVTLRGPVKSADEKATIAAVSKATEGVRRVDNQLEVEQR